MTSTTSFLNDLSIVVMKFGGTSVARPDRWQTIARLTGDAIASGRHPVLVCSALSGITSALDALTQQSSTETLALGAIRARHFELADAMGVPHEVLDHELDHLAELAARTDRSPGWRAQLLACGERLSTRLGAAWLERQGISTHWVDARQLLCAASDGDTHCAEHHLSACCDFSPNSEARAMLRDSGAACTITQGFVARDRNGGTVVLGRGGSDTSAAYLASVLGAERLEIWTDVPGLFTTDPRVSDSARLLRRASYREAAVFGAMGAKVLHPRCLEPVEQAGIELAIRWTDVPDAPGTVIDGADNRPGIKAITSRDALCLISMKRDPAWQPVGFMSAVSACFQSAGLSMDLVSSSPGEIKTSIDLAANPAARGRLPELMTALEAVCTPTLIEQVTCISLVGSRLTTELSRIAGAMQLLETPTVHLVSHAADDSHVSYLVDRASGPDLLAAVHTAVFRAPTVTDSGAFGPTWRELLRLRDTAAPAATPSVGATESDASRSEVAP